MVDLQTVFVAVIDELSCDLCRACLRVRPTGGLMWISSESTLLIDPWSCGGCGNCVTECPRGAISLHPRGSA